MPCVAVVRGLRSLGSLLPPASIEHRAASAPQHLLPGVCGAWRVRRCPRPGIQRAFQGLPQPLGHAFGGRSPANGAPCCTLADGEGVGGDGTEASRQEASTEHSGSRWRLEEGNDEVHSGLNVVLVSPQIPGNAGSIARTCAAAGVRLHLVEPMAFQLDDAKLKRAGLDYWPYVCVAVHSSWSAFMEYFEKQPGPKRLIGFSKKATILYTDVCFQETDWLLFGAETTGFPPDTVAAVQAGGQLVRIPMSERHVRSLNLSVSVGIGLFECLRQLEGQHAQAGTQQQRQDAMLGAERTDSFTASGTREKVEAAH